MKIIEHDNEKKPVSYDSVVKQKKRYFHVTLDLNICIVIPPTLNPPRLDCRDLVRREILLRCFVQGTQIDSNISFELLFSSPSGYIIVI